MGMMNFALLASSCTGEGAMASDVRACPMV
jgi:hypothetical protein